MLSVFLNSSSHSDCHQLLVGSPDVASLADTVHNLCLFRLVKYILILFHLVLVFQHLVPFAVNLDHSSSWHIYCSHINAMFILCPTTGCYQWPVLIWEKSDLLQPYSVSWTYHQLYVPCSTILGRPRHPPKWPGII